LTKLKFNNLFFALWPDQSVRSELVRIQQDVCGQNGRLHHPQDLHMTLIFLGKVSPERIDCVMQAAEAVKAEPFTLELNTTGYWKRPRIRWCGPDQTPGPLSQLVRDLQQDIEDCGFQPEKRTYKPHVTLARKVGYEDGLERAFSIIWQPQEFALAGSHSDAKPPRYKVIERWSI
jgi:2'-5' RNA ligase